jgi:predicted DNA repair protein MutK
MQAGTFSVDFSSFKVPTFPEGDGTGKHWWLLLLVNTNHITHTQIEKTDNIREFIRKNDPSLSDRSVWQIASAVRVEDELTAEIFEDKFKNATIRGSLSRSVVLEQMAALMGLDVYNSLAVIFRTDDAEEILERRPRNLLESVTKKKKKKYKGSWRRGFT